MFLFMESFPHGWGWTSAFWWFPGWGDLCLGSSGWRWILSLWRAVPCSLVCVFEYLWVWYGFGQPVCYCAGLCSCFAEDWHKAFGTGAYWSLMGAWSQCWGLRESSLNNPWHWEFSGSPKLWTWISQFWGLGPTPYCNTKAPQATQHRRQNPKEMVKATLNRQKHPKKVIQL